jgi:hypothetical protein
MVAGLIEDSVWMDFSALGIAAVQLNRVQVLSYEFI